MSDVADGDGPAPGADIEEIRRFLLDAGVPAERVDGSRTGAELRDVLLEHRLLGTTPRRSLTETADRLGLTAAELALVWTAIGMPVPDADEPVFSSSDEAVLESFLAARGLFGTDELLRFTRVFGSAVARISEAAFSLFTRSVEDPLLEKGGSQVDLTLAADDAVRALDVLPQLFVGLLERHALHAIRRLNAAHGNLPTHDQVVVTIGFADLIGSTRWTARQTPAELAVAIGRFEQIAHEALRGPGRLVKMIGDEAMFVTIDAVDGCQTALAIVEAVAAEPLLPAVRVGLATGLAIALDGDYYGTEVNRAARLVASAGVSQVVAAQSVVDAVDPAAGLRFTPLEPAALDGLGTEDRYAVGRDAASRPARPG